ncbi:MAG: site-specific integrase, partial [Acidimicrobiia bacterium]|nr:site-specific integrase [Acidimicrobiia bacterium]
NDVWTPDELAKFVNETNCDRLAAVWRIAAMTGLRRSEVCGLTWPDVDLEVGVISVRRAAVVADGRRHVKAPKTAASRRTVEMDVRTTQVLREWRKLQIEERLRAGEAWHDGQWVVADQLGMPIHPDWLSTLFARRAAELGLRPITLRQLRHSHATALLRAGAHPKVVQERLGHSSIRVTLDVYSAVLPNMQREAVERLAHMFDAR